MGVYVCGWRELWPFPAAGSRYVTRKSIRLNKSGLKTRRSWIKTNHFRDDGSQLVEIIGVEKNQSK